MRKYFIEYTDEGEIYEIVRFIREEKKSRAEYFSGEEWIKDNNLFFYDYDRPPNAEEVSEAEVFRIIENKLFY